eukprot:4412463-Pleurochrysis_carterae.AAC.3
MRWREDVYVGAHDSRAMTAAARRVGLERRGGRTRKRRRRATLTHRPVMRVREGNEQRHWGDREAEDMLCLAAPLIVLPELVKPDRDRCTERQDVEQDR